MNNRQYVLLDRDGTIIVERHYLSDPADVDLLPGAAKGLRKLQNLGLGLIVVTNQSAIGRGMIDEARLTQIHAKMKDLLMMEGVTLDGIYYCPHLPETGCDCRKPLTGMAKSAMADFGFDARNCFVIGDKICDIELGRNLGALTLLVRTGYGEKTQLDFSMVPDFVVADLDESANTIAHLLRQNEKKMETEI